MSKTQNKIKSKIFLLLVVLILFSCGNPICERGEGRATTQTFQLGVFRGVDISSWGDVEIIKSTGYKLEIHAQSNVINRFRINVRNNTLHVGADCFNTRTSPKLRIYSPEINSIRLSGAGSIESTSEFTSDKLEIALSGSGDIKLYGETNDLSVEVSGSGDVDLMDVKAESAKVKISGVSECSVYAEKSLKIKISGSGKVYYKGYPEIEQEISGIGKVISRN